MKQYPDQDIAKRVTEKHPFLAENGKSADGSGYGYEDQEVSGFSVAYAIEAYGHIKEQPKGGLVVDADTILREILGGLDIEIGTGVEALECWLESASELEAKSAEAMFEILTGVPFGEFVQRCIEETRLITKEAYAVVSEILWDGEDVPDDLPTEVRIPVSQLLAGINADGDVELTEEDILSIIAAWLSDEYGFCHDGFAYEGIVEEE